MIVWNREHQEETRYESIVKSAPRILWESGSIWLWRLIKVFTS